MVTAAGRPRRRLARRGPHHPGAAAGIGADTLASACQSAEASDKATAPPLLDRVRNALEIALGDVAAYRHELMLRSLKG